MARWRQDSVSSLDSASNMTPEGYSEQGEDVKRSQRLRKFLIELDSGRLEEWRRQQLDLETDVSATKIC